jgi:spore coat-associated protein N
MKKILMSLVVIALAVGAVAGGTFAYFSDTAVSTNNQFTSGTLNLKLADNDEGWSDGVTATWSSPSNWAPGEEVDVTIHLLNSGSIPVEAIYAWFNNLNDPNGLSNVIEVTWLSDSTWLAENSIGPFRDRYDGLQGNNDGKLSLAELVNGVGSANTPAPNQARFYGDLEETYVTPVLAANGGTFDIKMKYKFMETAGNEYQGTWATFDLTLQAAQHHYTP